MAGGSRCKKRRARRRRSQKRNPAAELTDDLLLEILACVPYRSLSRFRCVSKRWNALISDPDNRGRLPQTLAGFFYRMTFDPDQDGGSPSLTSHGYGFFNVSGTGPPIIDPSSSFLPEREDVKMLDCCNGLILCHCRRFADSVESDYLVQSRGPCHTMCRWFAWGSALPCPCTSISLSFWRMRMAKYGMALS
ncbi:unnamed protein product [Urochloa humidicola]